MIKTMKNLFLQYKEIIMYLIMGGGTTIVNWCSYAAFVSHLPIHNTDTKVLTANIISWVLAVTFAYITNKIWVFESHNWNFRFVARELFLFVSTRFLTGLLEIFGVPLLIKIGFDQTILGIEGMLSKVLVSILVVILNYIFSKLVIFKKKPQK